MSAIVTGRETVVRSPIAAAMGARTTVTGPVDAIYLVKGRDSAVESLVKRVGGGIVLRLPSFTILATLPFPSYSLLKGSRRIAWIGPVTIDLKRLAKVTATLAATAGSAAGGAR